MKHLVRAWGLLVLSIGAVGSVGAAQPVPETYAGRSAFIYTPASLPAFGSRAMVVVLHGGLGNAQRLAQGRLESVLNMNAVADEGGFVGPT